MTDKQLALLRHVARSGSFTQAAKELGVAQSTVSREIALLEAEVQSPLFYRSKEGVVSTPAGKYLRDTGFGTLTAKITGDCRRVAQGKMPGLQLAMDMPGAILAQPVLDALAAMKLDLPLEAYTYKSFSLVNLLLTGDTNAAIMQSDAVRKERRLTCQHLCSPHWLVAAREDHEYWSMPQSDRAVLRRQTVIFDAQTTGSSSLKDLSEPVSQYCVDLGLPVRQFLRANFFQDQVLMLQTGLGVGLVPPFAAEQLPPGIRLSDELALPFAPEYALVYRTGTQHPGVQILAQLCEQQFGGERHDR